MSLSCYHPLPLINIISYMFVVVVCSILYHLHARFYEFLILAIPLMLLSDSLFITMHYQHHVTIYHCCCCCCCCWFWAATVYLFSSLHPSPQTVVQHHHSAPPTAFSIQHTKISLISSKFYTTEKLIYFQIFFFKLSTINTKPHISFILSSF